MVCALDESSGSAASQPGKVEKKSYVPRRLVIGNEEYVAVCHSEYIKNVSNYPIRLTFHACVVFYC